MRLRLAHVRTLFLGIPKHAKLAYCLLRDERVPPAPKAALLAALGVIVSPLDLPAWIPVIGELDMLALSVLAVKTFVEACPDEIVHEHEAALKRKDSRFHQDWRALTGSARESAARAYVRWQERRAG
jgi:uncharacterized membrane protein YkvA (DUF1232 family)